MLLEIRDISKKYENKEVLKSIHLEIQSGEIVSLLGPSGSGKTTLLNVILGLTTPTSGDLIFNGEVINKKSMKDRGFNIVFQNFALFPHLNAYDNIIYGLKNKKVQTTQEEVNEYIRFLELEDHLRKPIQALSGGQKQRVSIARTLVMRPKILLLDEPLSALDGVIKESIKERIYSISREFNLTTIMVTHDPEEALTISDKVVIIKDGQVSQFGTPNEIIRHPQNRFIESFILHQLQVKRQNIYKLFGEAYA